MNDHPETMSDALRALADLLDANPDLPTPDVKAAWHNHSGGSAEAMAEQRRILGGEWRKNGSGDHFWLAGRLGLIELTIFAQRDQVCRRVVTTETVKVPAVAAQPERTETREVVEWDCEPVLAAEAAR